MKQYEKERIENNLREKIIFTGGLYQDLSHIDPSRRDSEDQVDKVGALLDQINPEERHRIKFLSKSYQRIVKGRELIMPTQIKICDHFGKATSVDFQTHDLTDYTKHLEEPVVRKTYITALSEYFKINSDGNEDELPLRT